MSKGQQNDVSLKDSLREAALSLGFCAFGVCAPSVPVTAARYREWIEQGEQGGMDWMARDLERRLDPTQVLKGVKSVISLGLNYYQPKPERRGEVAAYALGGDYHKLFNSRLKQFCEILRSHGGENRPYADTGPILEKPTAQLAGLGWQGKHTNLVHEKFGNWLFLGTVLTTLDLPPDAPAKDRCGSCHRCIDACPTGAITGPYRMDARRCISYLTIEHRGAIPLELRALVGGHLYGCDDCIAACPWNRWAVATKEERFSPRPLPDPVVLLGWTQEDFDRELAGMAMRRTKLQGLKRNACIVLGNTGGEDDIAQLKAAALDEDEVVAEAAQWALGQIRARL